MNADSFIDVKIYLMRSETIKKTNAHVLGEHGQIILKD